jgi:DNA repair exonuclease SbcCD ATPase subunit
MRLVSLVAENVKRLKTVEIKFDGPLVQIAGKNGQGKTSILDAIWWAFTGAKNIQTTPIRKGCEEARIVVDLGEIIITRTFASKKDGTFTTDLKIQSAEGARFPSPQAMLDKLFSRLTFDPLDFDRRPPKEQVAMLQLLVPEFDFVGVEQRVAKAFAQRTEVGRDCDRVKAAADSITAPPDTPDEPVDEEKLANELEAAVEQNAQIEKRRERREATQRRVQEIETQVAALNAELKELSAKLIAAEALPEPVDVEILRARHRELRSVNEAVERKKAKAKLRTQHDAHEAEYQRLTEIVEQGRESIARAVAEADLPVAGLSFGGEAVSLNGLPFEQASDAERLRVSTAVAMALNPDLRVIRVRDGSLLDDDAMRLLASMATEQNYLVIVERVKPTEGVGVIVEIEDGTIKT